MSLIRRDFVKDISVLNIFVYFVESLSFMITFPRNLETRILYCFVLKKPQFPFRRIIPTHSRKCGKYRREWRCCFPLYRHFIVPVWVKTSLCMQIISLKTGWNEWGKLLIFVEHSKYRRYEFVSLQYACPCVGGGSYIKLTMTVFVPLIWK